MNKLESKLKILTMKGIKEIETKVERVFKVFPTHVFTKMLNAFVTKSFILNSNFPLKLL